MVDRDTPYRVMMIRPHLSDLPAFELAQPYTIRWHADGDAKYWTELKTTADAYHDGSSDSFHTAYGKHLDLVAQRQAFLCDESGEPVGTVTAWWFEELSYPSLGKVNWMLIAPRAQGRGLSKPLLAACCDRLASLGHTKAALYTLTARIPAINLYRSFGFVPLIRDEADADAWDATSRQMKHPYAATDYVSAVDAGVDPDVKPGVKNSGVNPAGSPD